MYTLHICSLINCVLSVFTRCSQQIRRGWRQLWQQHTSQKERLDILSILVYLKYTVYITFKPLFTQETQRNSSVNTVKAIALVCVVLAQSCLCIAV